MLSPLFWPLLGHRSNLSSHIGKSKEVTWLSQLVRLRGCRSCYFMFIYGCFGDSSFSYYISCRFQLFYVKILMSILSSIISFNLSSSSSLKLPTTPFSDYADWVRGLLVFLTSQMMTSFSELLTRSSNLLLYVLDSSITSFSNFSPLLNTCFKIHFLIKWRILLIRSFESLPRFF